jgi:ribosomal protein S7
MEWTLYLQYKRSKFQQKATVEYSSRQVMRIRVHGSRTTLLLQNDYPAIRFANSKKGVKWKILQGALEMVDKESTQLLVDIFSQLESLMKRDFIEIYPNELF